MPARDARLMAAMRLCLERLSERNDLRVSVVDRVRAAVRARDWAQMLELGGNVYFLVKIAVADGRNVPEVVAAMTGQTVEEYISMMRAGGRNPNG